ncbi:MAG: type I CRISPR-associated protein Cas7, partial [Sphaerospermopsis kisseleviana]
PNGDPDAGNQPRTDPQTNQGLVTDACLKRKVRNYIQMLAPDEQEPERFKIFIRSGSVLNNTLKEAYDASETKKGKKNKESVETVNDWMLQNYYDVRMFGAVMSTGDYQAGQVWGPVQI